MNWTVGRRLVEAVILTGFFAILILAVLPEALDREAARLEAVARYNYEHGYTR